MCIILYLSSNTVHGQQYVCGESYVLILKCRVIMYKCLYLINTDTPVKVGVLLCYLQSLLQKISGVRSGNVKLTLNTFQVFPNLT